MAFPSIEAGMSRPSSSVHAPPSLKTRSRTQSISSDRPSTIAYSIMSSPLSVSPEAAFIAASAASQIVTNDHDSHADTWYDEHGIEPSSETAMVSPGALNLVNNWLDQLLFNFLSISRSTSLNGLRPAVSEVLKPKLAKDAMNQADEELREYLGGSDDDEDSSDPAAPGSPRDWDLELVWKRTRLRCMVYSSLGDMEEEDEDYHMEHEHLEVEDDSTDLAVSPAVAIFLTSILEFMGEHALIIAGQAAYHRLRTMFEKQLKDGNRHQAQFADRIVVEELDMERVALDRTLGRLWRAWKKRIRSPTTETPSFLPSFSRDSMRSPLHQRQSSLSIEHSAPQSSVDRVSEAESANPGQVDEADDSKGAVKASEEASPDPAAIPLPETENDLMEILIPGYACQSDDEVSDTEEVEPWTRPKSLMILPHAFADFPTPTMSQPHTPNLPTRKRSNSLPTPSVSPYSSPAKMFSRVTAVEEMTNAESQAVANASASVVEEEVDIASDTEDDDETETVNTRTPTQRGTKARTAPTALPEAAPFAQSASTAQDESSEEDQADEDHTGDFDFSEEPEILTGSRVSLSGRSSSPSASESGRRISIAPGFPMRSSSVHSLRVIDVGPRSPGFKPQQQQGGHFQQSSNPSRTSSISVSRNAEDRQVDCEVSEGRIGSVLARPPLVADSGTVSEIAEQAPRAAGSASTPKHAAHFEIIQSETPPAKPDMPSKISHSSPPRSAVPQQEPQPVTNVTIIEPPTAMSGTLFVDDDQLGTIAHPQTEEEAPRPALPLRSSSREVAAQIKAQDATMAYGIDRPSTAKRSPTSPRTIHKSSPKAERSSPGRTRDLQQSQAKNWHHASAPSSSSNKFKTARASEENNAMRSEDLARNFEELIQSDQTIQYTLTPESMRDIDSIKSGIEGPVVQSKPRRSGDQSGNRSRSSSGQKSTEVKRSTSLSRSTGLSSHPVDPQNSLKLGGPIPRSTPAMPSKSRGNAPQARDARVLRESMLDFVEFIRATGPTADSVSMSPASRANGVNGARTSSRPLPVAKNSIDSSRPSTNSNRTRYQARDATVDYKDDNSDLIDFIRRGPPTVAGGNPRIPRTVAPFRNTMDSDQLTAAVGGKAVDATLPDIRYSGASASVTENSSMNSSTVLLKKDRSIPQQQQKSNMFDDEVIMPQRKTRRVKDPYAIDDSDEDIVEEEEYQVKPKWAQTREESLIDFLKNVPPPPPEPIQPIRTQQLSKKKSAPSLMSRFTRNRDGSGGSFFSMSSGSPTPRHPSESARSLNSRSGASISGHSAGGSRGYVPIQVNIPSGADKFGPGYTSSPLGPLNPEPSRPTGRVPMNKFEARDAQPLPSSRATNDLADFLRSSGPPGGMGGGSRATQRSPPAQEDSSGSLGKVFRSRKKNSVA